MLIFFFFLSVPSFKEYQKLSVSINRKSFLHIFYFFIFFPIFSTFSGGAVCPSRHFHRTCLRVSWSAGPSRWGNRSPGRPRCWRSWGSLGSRLWSRCPHSRTLAASRKEGRWGRCPLPSVPVQSGDKDTRWVERMKPRLHHQHAAAHCAACAHAAPPPPPTYRWTHKRAHLSWNKSAVSTSSLFRK